MSWPQIVWIITAAAGLLTDFSRAVLMEKPLSEKVISFIVDLSFTLLIAWLFWCGGFFSQAEATSASGGTTSSGIAMNWPQITWVIYTALGLSVAWVQMLIGTQAPTTQVGTFMGRLLWTLFIVSLLWCGGFFSQAQAAQPPAAAQHYRDATIRNARLVWGLNAPVADFAAQIHQESHWRPDAVSPVGAEGLGQFMPATTRWFGDLVPELAARAPFNPDWSIRALMHYDRWLWQRLDAANDCERMAMTLSAYNGGLGWVQRDRRLAVSRGLEGRRWFGHIEQVNAGRSPAAWRENRHYPARILRELAPRYLSWGGSSCV